MYPRIQKIRDTKKLERYVITNEFLNDRKPRKNLKKMSLSFLQNMIFLKIILPKLSMEIKLLLLIIIL